MSFNNSKATKVLNILFAKCLISKLLFIFKIHKKMIKKEGGCTLINSENVLHELNMWNLIVQNK